MTENMKRIEAPTPTKVIRNGQVAVLVSPAYGAGWSSWAPWPDVSQFLLFDARLVDACEREASTAEIDVLLTTLFPTDPPYTDGWDCVEIQWVPVGTRFIVHEYDGYETLKVLDKIPFYVA